MKDRVVVVTGANNGIGLAMTQSLVDMGDRVAALDLSIENLQSLMPEEERLRAYRCDVTDRARVGEAVSDVIEIWGGVVHNVSSGLGLTSYPGISGYASTKGALEALTRTLALEFEPFGITVNLIHPPLTRTKSSAPLGVPAEMMADPVEVGRKLAKMVGQTKPVLTPDLGTNLGTAPALPGADGTLPGQDGGPSVRAGRGEAVSGKR